MTIFPFSKPREQYIFPYTGQTEQALGNTYVNKTRETWASLTPSMITGHSSHDEQHEQKDQDLVASGQGRVS